MPRTFRFPIPREERLLTLVAAIASPLLLCALAFGLAGVARSADLTLTELFDHNRTLRASVAAMGVVYLAAMYGLWTFVRVKNGARLTLGETVHYERPAAPVFGGLARNTTLPIDAVDNLAIERVRRGTVERVELRLSAGRDEIAVNLGHAVEGDATPRSARALLERDAWRSEPLVVALEEATGLSATLL